MAQASAANRLVEARRSPFGRFPIGAFLRSSGPSLALGLLIALLLQLIARLPAAPPASPDASPASRVTWSVLVCVSLGLATALVRRRVVAMATAGLVGAPIAFVFARAARRGSVGLLRALEGGGASPLLVGAIKGTEYGCVGLALGLVGRRRNAGGLTYAAVGLVTGLVFGGANLLVTTAASPGSVGVPALLAWLVNEVLFPGGCAMVVWTVDHYRQLARRSRAAADQA